MTDPWEWQEQDLQALVAQEASEDVDLEFKSCGALDVSTPQAREKSKANLSKDVSCLANSGGGTIIFGIVEKKGRAAQLDTGFDPAEIGQDWIHQVINSKIHPRMQGVRIKPVHLATHSPGRVAYVVYVPQATTAHQAADKLYYSRRGTECLPMEDYEIRDVVSRVSSPKLRVEMRHKGRTEGSNNFRVIDAFQRSPDFEFSVVNDPSAAAAEYAQIHLFLLSQLSPGIGPFLPCETTTSSAQGGRNTYQEREYRITRSDVPVFPGERRVLGTFWLGIPQEWPEDVPSPLVIWRVRANNAPSQVGGVLFTQHVFGLWEFTPAGLDKMAELGITLDLAP